MVTLKHITHLKDELKKRGHTQFAIGWECAAVKHGAKGTDIMDDTANIMTSDEYLKI